MAPINFHGTKVVLFHGDSILTYLRDMKESIPFPGMWDFPGGGREGDETPVECALRELEEEFGIRINASQIFWKREYPSAHVNGASTYFMAGFLTEFDVRAIKFGDEGQRWAFTSPDAFVACQDAVPHLRNRLETCFSEISSALANLCQRQKAARPTANHFDGK